MPRQRQERRVAGSTPRRGAACLSVRRLLLVVAHMGVNTQGEAPAPYIALAAPKIKKPGVVAGLPRRSLPSMG
jgi:hypothetical protein